MNDGSFEAGKVFGMMILVFSAYWLAGIAGAAVLYLLVKRIRAGRK